ncbi:hypothetical protein TNCV_598081 [Trichonephila clavipes]|nr:hypothetical protein TNCV_598081 [Trichonephila clavipes]
MSTRVTLLTAGTKALRLARARHHRHWTFDDWKHVAWSDKSLFHMNRADGRVRLFCQHLVPRAGASATKLQSSPFCVEVKR